MQPLPTAGVLHPLPTSLLAEHLLAAAEPDRSAATPPPAPRPCHPTAGGTPATPHAACSPYLGIGEGDGGGGEGGGGLGGGGEGGK